MTNPKKKGYLLQDEPADPPNTTASDSQGPTPMPHSSSQESDADIGPGGQGSPVAGRLQSKVGETLRDPTDGRYAFVTFTIDDDGIVTLDGWVMHPDIRDGLVDKLRAIHGVTDVVCRLRIDD
ncbi:hypothetical protein PCA31118_00096 [Pandoraea captiosa]|uniref:BON domain-containing protein n=1 Tax=Pandoraea captiosa TaxID=2508302 RepID=A0A5E4ZGA3_9BURK|nr:BON domain-containing protein [Pandoraea captiosa]VVE60026.1 hypothetical protein PCA31118_00096 [Pandoraea captiosa]